RAGRSSCVSASWTLHFWTGKRYTFALQGFMNMARKFQRMRTIAVYANCIGLYTYIHSLLRLHLTFLHHAQHLAGSFVGVSDQGIGLTAGGKCAILLIGAIGKYFVGCLQTQPHT